MGYALGASEYMTKPINRERMVTVIRKYIQLRGVKPVSVYNYVKLIYRKTGLNKRAALIAWAKVNGLDDRP